MSHAELDGTSHNGVWVSLSILSGVSWSPLTDRSPFARLFRAEAVRPAGGCWPNDEARCGGLTVGSKTTKHLVFSACFSQANVAY